MSDRGWRWGVSDISLLLTATLVVCTFRLLLLVVPLRRLQRFISRTPLSQSRGADPFRISRAVTSVGHRIPGAECLPRALATQYLLRRRGIESELCLGVRKENGAFAAHAWVTCAGQVVIGQVEGSAFSELRKAG